MNKIFIHLYLLCFNEFFFRYKNENDCFVFGCVRFCNIFFHECVKFTKMNLAVLDTCEVAGRVPVSKLPEQREQVKG